MDDKNMDSPFDSDENGQQILPFDFPEDDDTDESVVDAAASKPPVTSGEDAKKPESVETARKKEGVASSPDAPVKSADSVDSAPPSSPSPMVLTKKKPAQLSPDSQADRKPAGDKKQAASVDSEKTKPALTAAEVKPAPRKLTPARKKADPKKNPLNRSVGGAYPPSHMLREARVRAGLTPEQVSRTTKIKEDFIVALENDDESSFPPKVFVTAYAKQLCKLYKVDPAPVVEGFEKEMASRDNGHKVPDEILQDIDSGKQINMREEERLKRIFKTALISIVAIVLLILGLKFAFQNSESENSDSATSERTSTGTPDRTLNQPDVRRTASLKPEELEVFMINQPNFTMTKLKVPDNDE
jgi:hypothetical protein